jgi:acetyltransferase-like isoleucine patch superfamily enzyme
MNPGYDRARAQTGRALGVLARGLSMLYSTWLRTTYPFAFMGSSVSIHYRGSIKRRTAHRIKLGNFVTIGKDSYLGMAQPTGEEGDPVIIIDDNCVIHWRSQIDARNCVHLECDVIVSQGVLITDHHGLSHERAGMPIGLEAFAPGGRIRIGQGSWIAHGAAIICSEGELILGRNCVVTANAVVTKSAPPYSVLSGNPARVIKQYDPLKRKWGTGSLRSTETNP